MRDLHAAAEQTNALPGAGFAMALARMTQTTLTTTTTTTPRAGVD